MHISIANIHIIHICILQAYVNDSGIINHLFIVTQSYYWLINELLTFTSDQLSQRLNSGDYVSPRQKWRQLNNLFQLCEAPLGITETLSQHEVTHSCIPDEQSPAKVESSSFLLDPVFCELFIHPTFFTVCYNYSTFLMNSWNRLRHLLYEVMLMASHS